MWAEMSAKPWPSVAMQRQLDTWVDDDRRVGRRHIFAPATCLRHQMIGPRRIGTEIELGPEMVS